MQRLCKDAKNFSNLWGYVLIGIVEIVIDKAVENSDSIISSEL